MKFSLFAHMERLNKTQNHEQLYADFITLCTMADEGGMRAIWTGEHHGMVTLAKKAGLSRGLGFWQSIGRRGQAVKIMNSDYVHSLEVNR